MARADLTLEERALQAERFQQILDQISAKPHKFLMDNWFKGPDLDPEERKRRERYTKDVSPYSIYTIHPDRLPNVCCTTAACIAGWAVALSGPKKRVAFNDIKYDAGDWLFLSAGERERIFFTESWPEPYWSRAKMVDTYGEDVAGETLANVAIDRINYFLGSGE